LTQRIQTSNGLCTFPTQRRPCTKAQQESENKRCVWGISVAMGVVFGVNPVPGGCPMRWAGVGRTLAGHGCWGQLLRLVGLVPCHTCNWYCRDDYCQWKGHWHDGWWRVLRTGNRNLVRSSGTLQALACTGSWMY
jgi:hypothetical protein